MTLLSLLLYSNEHDCTPMYNVKHEHFIFPNALKTKWWHPTLLLFLGRYHGTSVAAVSLGEI